MKQAETLSFSFQKNIEKPYIYCMSKMCQIASDIVQAQLLITNNYPTEKELISIIY